MPITRVGRPGQAAANRNLDQYGWKKFAIALSGSQAPAYRDDNGYLYLYDRSQGINPLGIPSRDFNSLNIKFYMTTAYYEMDADDASYSITLVCGKNYGTSGSTTTNEHNIGYESGGNLITDNEAPHYLSESGRQNWTWYENMNTLYFRIADQVNDGLVNSFSMSMIGYATWDGL